MYHIANARVTISPVSARNDAASELIKSSSRNEILSDIRPSNTMKNSVSVENASETQQPTIELKFSCRPLSQLKTKGFSTLRTPLSKTRVGRVSCCVPAGSAVCCAEERSVISSRRAPCRQLLNIY
jgi:hypothetical protein